jgi:carbon storage regulator CsrA
MLVLGRNVDEVVVIEVGGKRVEVMVVQATRTECRLGFTADRDVVIIRKELIGRPDGKIAARAQAVSGQGK